MAPLCLVLCAVPASAAPSEAQVKAAYLFKFASFVRWPDDVARAQRFRICVTGRDDVAKVLRDLVRRQELAGMPMEVEEISPGRADLAGGCQVLFLGRGVAGARDLRASTAGQPILTVGDRSSGTMGCVIDFLIRDGRVRFIVDQDRAARRNLELSSKLLDVALAVDQ
jgi:hypothetical protein